MAKRAEIEGNGKQIKAYLNPIITELDENKNYHLTFRLIDPSVDRME